MTRLTALVTGGSRGMGKAIVDIFTEEGLEVIAPRRTELDLSSPISLGDWCRNHAGDHVDILVNNAGINELGTMDQLSDAAWHAMMQVNLTAPFQIARTFLPGMVKRGWGRIVNIASIWGLVGRERRGGYSATKAGLIGMTRVMAVEVAKQGVLVNCISPGFVATELTRKNNSPEELAEIAKRIPAGRLAEAAEIAKAVKWLCSSDNSYLCGQNIAIDGGFTVV
jgi:NAD(P)-dependent dehydrogenase (short-subunit alcohol dehydrogenase family)